MTKPRLRLIRLITLLLIAGSILFLLLEHRGDAPKRNETTESNESGRYALTPGAIEKAFEAHQSNIIVTQEGHIIKILPDDNEGSRHQRFIVKLVSDHTILVAHNIDLAPKVLGLKENQPIVFRGEYEWNEKGGVIHWTHRDPKGLHEAGWLDYQGRRYQ